MSNKKMKFNKKYRDWAKAYEIDLPLMVEEFLDEEMEYYRNHVKPATHNSIWGNQNEQ